MLSFADSHDAMMTRYYSRHIFFSLFYFAKKMQQISLLPPLKEKLPPLLAARAIKYQLLLKNGFSDADDSCQSRLSYELGDIEKL